MITLTKEEIDTLLDRLRMGRVACEWAGESASAEVPKFQAAMDMLNEKLFRLAQEQQPVQEQVAWQPIETAPKTRKKVILFYLNRNNFPRTVMARWLTDDEAAETDTDCVGLEGGWYECIDNWDDYTEVAIHEGEPTHWMPLPPAPTSEGKPDVA